MTLFNELEPPRQQPYLKSASSRLRRWAQQGTCTQALLISNQVVCACTVCVHDDLFASLRGALAGVYCVGSLIVTVLGRAGVLCAVHFSGSKPILPGPP